MFIPFQAVDDDLGINGQIRYSLPANTTLFSIGATNGQIRTAVPLDYETAKSHQLLVMAEDSAPDSRTTVIPITVFVEDVEDQTPVFVERLYLANVPENAISYKVTQVKVCWYIMHFYLCVRDCN